MQTGTDASPLVMIVTVYGSRAGTDKGVDDSPLGPIPPPFDDEWVRRGLILHVAEGFKLSRGFLVDRLRGQNIPLCGQIASKPRHLAKNLQQGIPAKRRGPAAAPAAADAKPRSPLLTGPAAANAEAKI